MSKNIGLVWLRDDFRLNKNLSLIEATKNHHQVLSYKDGFPTYGNNFANNYKFSNHLVFPNRDKNQFQNK